MVDSATTRPEYRSVWRHLLTAEFRQGYVEAGGLRTRYVRAGAPGAPSLVLLHGTGGSWETWCANIPYLSEHFDCLAFDMLGCGFTDKPDRPYEIKDYTGHVLAVMNALEISRASFLGVSLGSWVTCRLALDAPERLDKMVLNSPAGLLPLSAASTKNVATRRTAGVDPSWDNVEKMLTHLFYDRASLSDDLIAIRQAIYQLPGMDQVAPRMLTLLDPEVRQRNLLTESEWRSLTAPALVIAHVDAPDDYLETALAVAELMPNAVLAEIHHASHWPHYEQPDVFNPLAEAFLNGDVIDRTPRPNSIRQEVP